MEIKFFALTVDDYMRRFGIDRDEAIETFGHGTQTIIEGHLTDPDTGEQHLTWARYTGPGTLDAVLDDLVYIQQYFNK